MKVFEITGSAIVRRAIDLALAIRALLFVGLRHRCPCCGWRLRAFTHGGVSLRRRPSGYCPRCNAKARHRRDWLYLERNTPLFTKPTRLLHISPKYSLARRFVRMPHLDYVAGDVRARPLISLRLDVQVLPFLDESFDAAICIHVLEHVPDDRSAMAEIFRVLRPGGWAFISVPLQLDSETYEDPAIVDPKERLRAFGETDHVRLYGRDILDRLHTAGFEVDVDLASDLSQEDVDRYGLLRDENVLLCRKPPLGPSEDFLLAPLTRDENPQGVGEIAEEGPRIGQ